MNPYLFILFQLNVYFFLLFQIFDLSLSFLHFTVDSLYIFLYFTLYSFCFFLYFATYSIISVSILITSVLNSVSDWLSLKGSPCPLVLFLAFWSVLSFGPHFFVPAHLLGCRGRSLRYSLGQGNPCHSVVMLSVREECDREQLQLAQLLPHFQSLPLLPTSRLCPFRCWFSGGWVCVTSRIQSASPMNSPKSLRVSPTFKPTTRFYS